MSYSYLSHVETEFICSEDEYGGQADELLREFFMNRKAVQSRAFMSDNLRYIFVSRNGQVEALEEEGFEEEPLSGDSYERIYRANGDVRIEEISFEEAERLL